MTYRTEIPIISSLFIGNGHDLQEIQRQNKITAQILENFLERRLFPNKRPTHKLPTVDEILPKTTVRPIRATPKPLDRPSAAEQFDDENVDDIDDRDNNEQDPESLQSVESEHVDSYYSDDDVYGAAYKNQGRWSLGG